MNWFNGRPIPLKDKSKERIYEDDYSEEEYADPKQLIDRITALETKLDKVIESNTLFLQSVVLELIKNPKSSIPASFSRYTSRDTNKPDESKPTAGPVGKLP